MLRDALLTRTRGEIDVPLDTVARSLKFVHSMRVNWYLLAVHFQWGKVERVSVKKNFHFLLLYVTGAELKNWNLEMNSGEPNTDRANEKEGKINIAEFTETRVFIYSMNFLLCNIEKL